MSDNEYPKTPELDKISEIQETSQKIGEFIDWLKEQGIVFAIEGQKEDLVPFYRNTESLLYEFFEIDGNKVEKERRQILKYLKKSQLSQKEKSKNG